MREVTLDVLRKATFEITVEKFIGDCQKNDDGITIAYGFTEKTLTATDNGEIVLCATATRSFAQNLRTEEYIYDLAEMEINADTYIVDNMGVEISNETAIYKELFPQFLDF